MPEECRSEFRDDDAADLLYVGSREPVFGRPRERVSALGMERWRDGRDGGRFSVQSETSFLLGDEREGGEARLRRRRKMKRPTTTTARNATLPATAPITVASIPEFEIAPVTSEEAEGGLPSLVPECAELEPVREGVMVEEGKEGTDVGEVGVRGTEVVGPTFWMEEVVDDAPNSVKRCARLGETAGCMTRKISNSPFPIRT